MKIAITGASGHLGRLVISQLKKRISADDIIALARTPEKVAELGVEVRKADYDRPETLGPALKGVDTLLLISANEPGKRAPQHRNVIEAAKEAGISWIVYTSLLHADRTTINLADEHLETEEMLRQSNIDHTILRNGWYTENYTNNIPNALAVGAFVGSASEGKISSAPRKDFAEAAVVVLTSEGHRGKLYELAGDEAYTLKELAAEISSQSKKNIPYHNLSEQEYSGMLETAGVPQLWARGIASWDIAASKGDLYDDSRRLSDLIGRPTTPMRDSVAEAMS